ncbi:NACHT, LRR and PYD domains-containing protein 1a-like isoform X3 [Branchiostoma floridae]|uniref:NACHT, LRR and PYD domains-containing protein 1a-like isoform X3 n=1 Tax=Branchiostoma floridae TaxID=7739 RepID=A0A9J7M024_BRAFL|nr:NACHT, LRR and PYD domains-containing protein 1a-like isoform X3 [Branchiostoma floridae]XP_035691615.1 NACHT, LRR and PYD domains-containing protein 1a-like isoform X3 [Branchiostoma floridae]
MSVDLGEDFFILPTVLPKMDQKASKAAKPGSPSVTEGQRREDERQSPPHHSEQTREHGANVDVSNNVSDNGKPTNIAPSLGNEDEEGVGTCKATDVDLPHDQESYDMALLALDQGRDTHDQVLDGGHECYNDGDVVAFSETENAVTQITNSGQVSGQGNKVINIGPHSTVTIFDGTSDEPYTVPNVDSPSEDFPLAQCQDSLKSYFKARLSYLQPLAWNEEVEVKIEDIFTTVDLVTRTQQGGHIERRALPSTADALTARPDCPQPRRILIEGNAGIGKTTEVSKLAFDWAEGRSPILEKYDLVFPIALRKVGESQSLTDCIFDQLLPEDVPFQESDLETYLKGNDRVLIILDGFDEWARHEGHDVTKLLTGKIFCDCCLLVTTRPSHTPQLQSLMRAYMRPDTQVEITGFSQDNIRTYVRKFFKGDKEKAATLVSKMDSSLIPTGILATPILLLLTCMMWEEKQDLVFGGRIFPLYDELVSFTIRRHCVRNNIGSNQGIPDNIKDALLCAGALAFNGLLQNNLVYNKEDAVKYCGEDSLQELVLLGILHRQESPSRLNPSDQFSFSHKTMQEYFAGLHFAKRLQDETTLKPTLNTYLKTAQSVRDLENMIIFACARLGPEADVMLAHLVKIYHEDVEYSSGFTKLLYLSRSEYSKCRVSGNEEGFLSPTDFAYIRYQTYMEIALLCFYESGCLSRFENIMLAKGNIQFSNVGPRVYNALEHVLNKIPPQSLRNVKSLCLFNTTQCFVSPVIGYLKMMSLSELNLNSACLGGHDPNTGPCARLAQQLPYLTTLRRLELSLNNLLCSHLLVLLPSLKMLVDLEKLDLSINKLAGCGKEISELPRFLRNLEVLDVSFCKLSLEDVLQIATAVVQYCPKMEDFEWRGNMTVQKDKRKVREVLRGLKS